MFFSIFIQFSRKNSPYYIIFINFADGKPMANG